MQILGILVDTTLGAPAGLLIPLLEIIPCDFAEHLEALLDNVLLEDTHNLTGDVALQILGFPVGAKLDALAGLLIEFAVIILCEFNGHLEARLDHVLLEHTHKLTGDVG